MFNHSVKALHMDFTECATEKLLTICKYLNIHTNCEFRITSGVVSWRLAAS